MLSVFSGIMAAFSAPEDDKPTATSEARNLSADTPAFVPAASSAVSDGENGDIDEYSEVTNEFEPRSASLDAEVNSEMEECLNAILKDQIAVMNYTAATRAKLSTISKQEQRAVLRTRVHRERSRDEVEEGPAPQDLGQDLGGVSGLSRSKRPVFEDYEEGGDDWAASKSFGRSKISNFYRTKTRQDVARMRHAEEVARRSGRRPNDRRIYASARHAKAPAGSDCAKKAARGGRHAARASFVVFQGQ